MALKKFFHKYRLDIFLLALLTLLAPLFFYKLGQSSLGSWDEAWYADVSRYMAQTGNLFNLVYNGGPFSDKPPGGFWIEALFFKIGGISELTARLPSAVAGLTSLYIIYLLGSKLFTRAVGFSSALALVSSFWFLFRARSGNLDSLLTLGYLLVIYFALLALEKKRYFLFFVLLLVFLPMIKGIVFIFAILPSLFLIFYRSKLYKLKDFLIPLFATFGLFGFWIITEFIRNPPSLYWHFTHSLRESSLENNYLHSLQLYKSYLHNGIGKWFWPGMLGLALSFVLKEKKLLILTLFVVFYSLQFLFSQEIQTWHLIPLHPFLILLFFGGIQTVAQKQFPALRVQVLLAICLLLFSGYFSLLQTRAAWYQFIDIPAYISDEAILAKEAGKYTELILIDGDFDPAGAFYAGRRVLKLYNPDLNYLFANEQSFLLITNDWRLKNERINPQSYEVIKTDRDKVLIRRR